MTQVQPGGSGHGLDFHHVGIACRSIATEQIAYQSLGFVAEAAPFEDPRQHIRGVFMINNGYRVELLEPLHPGIPSPVDPFLARGVKLYHQAFSTADLEAASAELVAAGALVTVAPVPAVAFDGRLITFLMLPTLSLVELIEAG